MDKSEKARAARPERTSSQTREDVIQKEDGSLSGTLARGLAILETLLNAPQPMPLGDVAAAVALDQSTALRLLRSLEESGHVLKIADGKRYLPSPRSIKPLPLTHPVEQFRRETSGIIADLAGTLNKTIVLVLFFGSERMVVDVALSTGSILPYYGSWLRGPLHASAPGKALLLGLDHARREELLGPEPYVRHTPLTKVTFADVTQDLDHWQALGYAASVEEYYSGITAVGAPFASWSGRVLGCLAVTGHSREFSEPTIASVGARLLEATEIIPMQATSLRALDAFCGL